MVAPTFALYQKLRHDAGWDLEFGMVEKVWDGMGDEGRESAISQYQDMANQYQARVAELGEGWATW